MFQASRLSFSRFVQSLIDILFEEATGTDFVNQFSNWNDSSNDFGLHLMHPFKMVFFSLRYSNKFLIYVLDIPRIGPVFGPSVLFEEMPLSKKFLKYFEGKALQSRLKKSRSRMRTSYIWCQAILIVFKNNAAFPLPHYLTYHGFSFLKFYALWFLNLLGLFPLFAPRTYASNSYSNIKSF